jgi:integrase
MSDVKRPKKPNKKFPLFPHLNGSWAHKFGTKFQYFGSWKAGVDSNTAKQAYDDYVELQRAIKEGRAVAPNTPVHVWTVAEVINEFLNEKRKQVDALKLSERTFFDYKSTGKKMAVYFGAETSLESLGPLNFNGFRVALEKGRGDVAVGNEIQKTKVILKWVFDSDLIDRPIKTGPGFKKPTAKIKRRGRNQAGRRDFSNTDILKMIEAASTQLKAMILLGVNAGLGNHDIALLPKSAINIKTKWLVYPRHKTEVARKVPLWDETIEAIKRAIEERPEAKLPENEKLVFLTRTRQPWVRMGTTTTANGVENTGVWIDSISMETRKLLLKLGIKRSQVGFYGLRRTLETVGGEFKDQVAVDALMGHAPSGSDMSAVYREGISDQRLRDVVEHVRVWLYSKNEETDEDSFEPPAESVKRASRKSAPAHKAASIDGRPGRKPGKRKLAK